MKNSYFRQKSRSGNDECDVNLLKLKCPHKPPFAILYAMPCNGNTVYTIYSKCAIKSFCTSTNKSQLSQWEASF